MGYGCGRNCEGTWWLEFGFSQQTSKFGMIILTFQVRKPRLSHSSILAWRSPWTAELSGLQSMGLQRVGHNWATFTFTVTALKSTFLTEFSFYPNLRCWWVTGLGSRPDLSDVRARALSHDFVHTMHSYTHTHTHRHKPCTHIPLTQQAANGEIWTVSTWI